MTAYNQKPTDSCHLPGESNSQPAASNHHQPATNNQPAPMAKTKGPAAGGRSPLKYVYMHAYPNSYNTCMCKCVYTHVFACMDFCIGAQGYYKNVGCATFTRMGQASCVHTTCAKMAQVPNHVQQWQK